MLKIFIANTIRLPIDCSQLNFFNTNLLKSKEMAMDNQVLGYVFDKNILSSTIEPPILNQLKKQQNNCFYDFNQYQISSKLQTTFMTGIKIHQRKLWLEPSNYWQLNSHLFEMQSWKNMVTNMQEHWKQFKFWKKMSHKEVKSHQVIEYKWVLKYNADKYSNLHKCKARLVVCGNQQ